MPKLHLIMIFHFRIITDVVALKSNTKYVVATSCDLKAAVTVTVPL